MKIIYYHEELIGLVIVLYFKVKFKIYFGLKKGFGQGYLIAPLQCRRSRTIICLSLGAKRGDIYMYTEAPTLTEVDKLKVKILLIGMENSFGMLCNLESVYILPSYTKQC